MTRKHASAVQLLDSFSRLSKSDLKCIHSVAKRYIQGTKFSDSSDIIHQVIFDCIEGKRNWPLDIRLAAFIIQCMKSSAHSERTSYECTKVISLESSEMALFNGEFNPNLSGQCRPHETYEDKEYLEDGKNKIQELKSFFATDPIAAEIIYALSNDIEAIYIIEKSGIEKKDYQSARKRIYRYLTAQRAKSS